LITQCVLILGMLVERRRRHRMEGEASGQLAQIAHMNRRSTAGELCASITHELNQPLAAILSNAEAAEHMVSSAYPDLGEVRAVITDIIRDNNRASQIICRLRGLLKGAMADAAELDLNQAVIEVFALLSHQAAAREIELSTFLSKDKLRVRGDRIQLQQVILNLVMNALEAMDDIASGRREIIGRTFKLDQSAAEISITDNGPGIEVAKLNSIFRPFYTTKPNGMGMGLSIARKVVEAHGGQIWVANRSQGGAEFRLRLPLVQPAGR
jgi:signal transduction histidine kinase